MEIVLSAERISTLFERLNDELALANVHGEIFLVGGAVMCLVYNTRKSTRDVDAYFEPAQTIRKAAFRVAQSELVAEKWLNDAVKAYLSPVGTFTPYLVSSHLRVLTAQPDYLLAMKCLAMRLGPAFHDLDDVRYLLRYLNIETYEDAVHVIERFYPREKFPQKTMYALEEILGG